MSRKQQKTKAGSPKAPEAVKIDDGELSEQQLDQVTGGRKAGGTQQEYLVVTMKDVLITG